MHKLSQAAMVALDEIWGSIHEQCSEVADPAYQASLWRMAGNICTGFALQHRTAQELELSDQFEWLSLICDQRQLMALHPAAFESSDKLKLSIVQALPRTH